MLASKIIQRAAYEVGDEGFSHITQDEYLRYLERALRDLCVTSKLARTNRTFTLTTSKELILYSAGPPVVGDDIMSVYYMRYYCLGGDAEGIRCVEQVTDDVEAFNAELEEIPSDFKTYRVDRAANKLTLVWAHTPTAGDTVKIWYYMLPAIGSLALASDLPIYYGYQDDLVTGLIVLISKRMYLLASLKRDGLDKEAARVYSDLYKETKSIWAERKLKISQETRGFLDETIPIQIQVASPFEDLGFDEALLVDGDNA